MTSKQLTQAISREEKSASPAIKPASAPFSTIESITCTNDAEHPIATLN